MKKTIGVLLALCLSLSLSGCGGEGEGKKETVMPVQSEPEETYTLYVLTEATDYFADGSQGFFHATYTYTNGGLPLTAWEDWGTVEELWDEEAQVYCYQETTYDGNADIANDYRYDAAGSLIGQEGDDRSYTYEYNAQGQPESCYVHNGNAGAYTLYYHYNEAGLLESVVRSSGGQDTVEAAFRYDEEGRLTGSWGCGRENEWEYGYRYGENGELVAVTYGFTSASSAPEAFSGVPVERSAEFEYDSEGRLLSRKHYDSEGNLIASTLCDYGTMGKLGSVCYFQADGNLDDPFTYQHSVNGQTVCIWTQKDNAVTRLTYDKDGNLIRRDDSDGSYTLYEYQALELTARQLEKAQRAAYLLGGIDADGAESPVLCYRADCSYAMLLDLPQVSLHETDLLRN